MTAQPDSLEARLAAKLQALRKKKRLTLPEMAVGSGVGMRTYCDYEAGLRLPGAKNLNKLADFFKVSPSSLLK